jgi:hypothetical protein
MSTSLKLEQKNVFYLCFGCMEYIHLLGYNSYHTLVTTANANALWQQRILNFTCLCSICSMKFRPKRRQFFQRGADRPDKKQKSHALLRQHGRNASAMSSKERLRSWFEHVRNCAKNYKPVSSSVERRAQPAKSCQGQNVWFLSNGVQVFLVVWNRDVYMIHVREEVDSHLKHTNKYNIGKCTQTNIPDMTCFYAMLHLYPTGDKKGAPQRAFVLYDCLYFHEHTSSWSYMRRHQLVHNLCRGDGFLRGAVMAPVSLYPAAELTSVTQNGTGGGKMVSSPPNWPAAKLQVVACESFDTRDNLHARSGHRNDSSNSFHRAYLCCPPMFLVPSRAPFPDLMYLKGKNPSPLGESMVPVGLCVIQKDNPIHAYVQRTLKDTSHQLVVACRLVCSSSPGATAPLATEWVIEDVPERSVKCDTITEVAAILNSFSKYIL